MGAVVLSLAKSVVLVPVRLLPIRNPLSTESGFVVTGAATRSSACVIGWPGPVGMLVLTRLMTFILLCIGIRILWTGRHRTVMQDSSRWRPSEGW